MDRSGLPLRLAYVSYLGAVALCSVLGFVGACRGEPNYLAVALAAAGLAMALRHVLRSYSADSRLDEDCEDELVSKLGGTHYRKADSCQKAGELAELLQEWDGLEQSRGTGRFDPWAVQAVRGEIRASVQGNPVLRQLLGSDV